MALNLRTLIEDLLPQDKLYTDPAESASVLGLGEHAAAMVLYAQFAPAPEGRRRTDSNPSRTRRLPRWWRRPA